MRRRHKKDHMTDFHSVNEHVGKGCIMRMLVLASTKPGATILYDGERGIYYSGGVFLLAHSHVD
jgi:hypothetical protein